MRLGVSVEISTLEQRVALVPNQVPDVIKMGLEVCVQSGAGEGAGFTDHDYKGKGAEIVSTKEELFSRSDILLKLRGLGEQGDSHKKTIELLRPDHILIGMLDPFGSRDSILSLAEKGCTSYALELLPRISRAQSMDILTSMKTLEGYKGSILAAATLNKIFPMMMTAAGTVAPARALVMGAGITGLQTIATMRRLGAVVKAYDIRPAVKEQVESLGGSFLELDIDTSGSESEWGYAKAVDEQLVELQRTMMLNAISKCDVLITTASVYGKQAPLLVTGEMMKCMRRGSVVIDLASDYGGNCELSEPGKTIQVNGVTLIAPVNLASTVPLHASEMVSRNFTNFISLFMKDGKVEPDYEDEIIKGTLLTDDGKIVHKIYQEYCRV